MPRKFRYLLAGLVFGLLQAAGCTGQSGSRARDQADINVIATLYRSYARAHGAPPPNEQAFRQYIASLPPEKQRQLAAEDVDRIFISPRDQKPYVVIYGEATNGKMPNVYAYEQEGAGGKRWVANVMGYVSELDEAEFREKVAEQPSAK